MSRPYNFSAGPATLPEAVLRQARDEMLDWHGVGASIVELSHRGPEFMQVAAEAEADLRTLMSIPDDYALLFLPGGATTAQALIPLNFAAPGQAVDYVVTGHWGKTALKQAKPYVATNVAANGEAGGFRDIPARADWNLSGDAAYVHYTANETIHGVEFRDIPDTGDVPLVADFSSSIVSEPLDVSRFGVIYAGAQKNLGPVGISVVIVRRDLLERAGQPRADIFDYRSHLKGESMLNTPPTWNWYLAGLVFKWMLAE
ncbi:MAG: 3-phosphoserine/phosphohydroxythreonine transaminase, partial [Lysobacter sp.]|nr:3-phosphoserine/phosphohydroxythreonine transaminase [Lysobacter sp.]